MFGNHEEKVFKQIWDDKRDSHPLNGIYRLGENQRVDFCLQYLSAGENFLDIGCGTGILASQLKDRFKEVHGIDIAALPIQVARDNNVEAIQLNMNTSPLPYLDRYFDTVTILSTLQYFYDLHLVLNEVRRVLKSGGQLVITVPNMRAIWRLMKLIFKGEFPVTSKDSVGYDGGALHYFCYSNLFRLLKLCGFRPVFSGGIYCIPKFVNTLPQSGWIGSLKREFFSAEIVVDARKDIN